MGEYLPDGTYQRDYTAICGGCGKGMSVNLYGQGTCPTCKILRDPMTSPAGPLRSRRKGRNRPPGA